MRERAVRFRGLDPSRASKEEYFPYGSPSDRRDARNRYRFIGVERDDDTGLCMTGPRTYEPVSGRFLQGDPDAGASHHPSPFEYSGGNPLKVFDRSGYSETYIETDDRGDVQLVTESDIVVEVRGRQREHGKARKNAKPVPTAPGKAPASTTPWIATLPPLGLPTEPWSDPWPDSPTLVPRQGPSAPKPPTTTGPSMAQRPAGVVALIVALLWPADTQEPWMDAADPRTGQPFQSREDYEGWKAAGRPGDPALEAHKKDKWYGYNNRDFHKWYHRRWKEPGAPDATKEEVEEAWRVWNDLGRPGPEEQ